MSYTLRGRVETRLAALLPVLLGACVLAGALHRWWPVELVALMAAVGLFLDLEVWHRLLPYQPAWATVPLGAVELGALMAIVYGFGLHAPLLPALALFGAGWLAARRPRPGRLPAAAPRLRGGRRRARPGRAASRLSPSSSRSAARPRPTSSGSRRSST